MKRRTRLFRHVNLILLLATLGACGGGGSGNSGVAPPPPVNYTYRVPVANNDGWTVAAANEKGVSVAALETMMTDILRGQYPYVDSIAVVRDGALVLDETLRTSTDEHDDKVANTEPAIHAQFSVSKSVTSLLVGVAIDEGYIDGVDTPYLALFPYTSYDNWDDRKSGLTLQHVLAMRLGLEWDEFDPPYSSIDNRLNRFYREETDFSKALLDLPLVDEPGTAFSYNTAASVSLGQAIENSVPLTLLDYSIGKLIAPLQISDVEVLTTPTGLPNGGSGLYVRTRDAAKFGQLMLDGGTWNGQRIVSEQWIAEAVTPRTSTTWADPGAWDWQVEGYGYQWWTGHYDVAGQPLESWVAWGYGGQWVVAVPALNMVIAVNSHGYDGGNTATNEAHRIIRNYLLGAVD